MLGIEPSESSGALAVVLGLIRPDPTRKLPPVRSPWLIRLSSLPHSHPVHSVKGEESGVLWCAVVWCGVED